VKGLADFTGGPAEAVEGEGFAAVLRVVAKLVLAKREPRSLQVAVCVCRRLPRSTPTDSISNSVICCCPATYQSTYLPTAFLS